MPKNRNRRWIFFLALTLGVAAWWRLGWYLAPRPLYTLRFPYCDPIGKTNSWYAKWSFEVFSFDKVDHFLLIQRPRIPRDDSLTIHVHDLRSGALLASHNETVENRDESSIPLDQLSEERGRAEPNGDWLFLISSNRNETGLFQPLLFKWNLLTNKRELIRTWPPRTRTMISENGTTLLEKNVLSPFLPNTLNPTGWGNYLTTLLVLQQNNDMNYLGATFFSVWALPELRLQSTFMVPSPNGLSEPSLTSNGKQLLLANAMLPFNFSERSELQEPKDRLLKPTGIQIYDLDTGQIIQHAADHPGNNFWLQELGPDLYEAHLLYDPDPEATKEREAKLERERAEKQRIEAEKNNGVVIEPLITRMHELPMGYFHLPSKKWINIEGQHFYESVYGLDSTSNNIRALTGTYYGGPYFVWEIDNNGVPKQIQKLENEFAIEKDFETIPQLIPRSNQCFYVRLANWPQWLREQGMKVDFLRGFFQPQRHELVFMDYCKQRELATIRVGAQEVSRAKISPKGSYLIVEHHNDQDHEVMVFSIPLADWSRWWSRCSGLLTSLLVWLLLRRLSKNKTKPHASFPLLRGGDRLTG